MKPSWKWLLVMLVGDGPRVKVFGVLDAER
jgi:hypothetical protein